MKSLMYIISIILALNFIIKNKHIYLLIRASKRRHKHILLMGDLVSNLLVKNHIIFLKARI